MISPGILTLYNLAQAIRFQWGNDKKVSLMGKVLITGATGNIGSALIRFLYKNNTSDSIIAGVRNISKAKEAFRDYPGLEYIDFDFESPETFDTALTGIDRVFLLRPPHISDVEKYFRPLISSIRKHGINEI